MRWIGVIFLVVGAGLSSLSQNGFFSYWMLAISLPMMILGGVLLAMAARGAHAKLEAYAPPANATVEIFVDRAKAFAGGMMRLGLIWNGARVGMLKEGERCTWRAAPGEGQLQAYMTGGFSAPIIFTLPASGAVRVVAKVKRDGVEFYVDGAATPVVAGF